MGRTAITLLFAGIAISLSVALAFFYLYYSDRRYSKAQGPVIGRTALSGPALPWGASLVKGYQGALNEDVVKRKLVFWTEPCVDTLHYFLDTRASLAELQILLSCTTKEDLKPHVVETERNNPYIYLNRYLDDLGPGHVYTLLLPYWSSSMGGFRQRPDLWVSGDACASALLIILELTHYDNRVLSRKEANEKAAEQPGVKSWLAACGSFVRDYLMDSGPMLGDAIGLDPCISSNHAGWMALRDLGLAAETAGRFHIDDFTKATEPFFWEREGCQAFRDTRSEEPSICATHHALATFVAQGAVGDKRVQSEVWTILRIEEKKVLKFVLESKCKGGGYSARPGEEPSTAHTRYAYALARSLITHPKAQLGPGEILSSMGADAVETLDFLRSMWTPLGFRLSRSVGPSIYSTRATLLVLKYLELFRVNRLITVDDKYREKMSWLVKQVGDQWQGIVDSQYKMDGGYAGYPRSLLP